MLNKVLVSIIIILIPFCLFVYFHQSNQKPVTNEEQKPEIIVYINKSDQDYQMNLETYLIGVVGAEMPASFNIEALKAQAIASRTFALYNATSNIINPTTSDQAYNTNEELASKWGTDFDEYYAKIVSAVNSTNNLVIKYNGNLIKSYYYSMSNGYTEDSQTVFNESYPYLNVVSSSFDSSANNYLFQKTFSRSEFCELLSITCDDIEISDEIRDTSNRVLSLKINNSSFSGLEVRKLLSIRSTDFSIIPETNNVIVETKGYGHGVGMSQYGANYLANNGSNYEDVIKYYYQNVEILNF